MSIVRVRREANYTVIPNEIINDKRLGWQELGLLVYLLSKPADWDIRVPALASDRDLKERAIYNAMKRFRELGYATFKKNQDGTAEWTVTDTPGGEITPNSPNEINQMSKTANCGKRKQQKPQIADSANCGKRNVIQKKDFSQQSTDEQKKKEHSTRARISISTAWEWENITEEDRDLWAKAYPAINIDTELARAAVWLKENPNNKKSNYGRFLANWLNRAQDRAPRVVQEKASEAGERNPGLLRPQQAERRPQHGAKQSLEERQQANAKAAYDMLFGNKSAIQGEVIK